jgi:hypothetical protein
MGHSHGLHPKVGQGWPSAPEIQPTGGHRRELAADLHQWTIRTARTRKRDEGRPPAPKSSLVVGTDIPGGRGCGCPHCRVNGPLMRLTVHRRPLRPRKCRCPQVRWQPGAGGHPGEDGVTAAAEMRRELLDRRSGCLGSGGVGIDVRRHASACGGRAGARLDRAQLHERTVRAAFADVFQPRPQGGPQVSHYQRPPTKMRRRWHEWTVRAWHHPLVGFAGWWFGG